jgi:hypothetical protein
MVKELHVRIRTPEAKLLEEVRGIIKNPAGASPEEQEQLLTLAKAIGALVDECDDLLASLKWLADNATFPPKNP